MSIVDLYGTTKDAAEISGVPYATVRSWMQKIGPAERGKGTHARFGFGALCSLRVLAQILAWGLPWSAAVRIAQMPVLGITLAGAQTEIEAGKPGQNATSSRWLYVVREVRDGRTVWEPEFASAEDVRHDLRGTEPIAESWLLVDLAAIRAHVASRLAEIGRPLRS